MTAPAWGHKPDPVADKYAYWSAAPPEPSPRCTYWVRRWRDATWKPNRWLRRECAECRAGMLGIWIWEARFVIHPLEQVAVNGHPAADVARWAGAWTETAPGPYWQLLEQTTRPGGTPVHDHVADLANALAAIQPGRPRTLTEAVNRTLGQLAK